MAATYLLDTNVISGLIRADLQLENWLSTLPEDSKVATCTIVRGEILFGIARLSEGKRRNDLRAKVGFLFDALPCEPVPQPAGDYYAALKLERRRSGFTLDENDLWIAATAIALGAILVSCDSDFNGIAGLSVLAIT